MAGPYPYPESYPEQPPQQPPPPLQGPPVQPYPEPPYPGMLPPPVPYRKRRRWPAVLVGLLALALVAGVVTAVVFAARDDGATASGGLTDEAARTAIQNYLDALSRGDDEEIARNTLCGLYDAVKEKRSDLALAGLAADAFRKQFSQAEVTTIDTIVPWSSNQAQVLFTMRVAPAGGSSRGQQPANEEEQAVAQLLVRDNQILVCSYLLRTGSQY